MECNKCGKKFNETKHSILAPGLELYYCSDRCLKTYYNDGDYEEEED